MLTDAIKNAMLDAVIISGASSMQLSAHSAYSAAGANLIGAKTAANFAAASGAAKTLAANCNISVPAGNTVGWVGAWDAAGTTFVGMQPNGGSDKSFQLDVFNSRVYCEGHGYANDQTITFHGDTAPAGLTAGTVYYVVGVTAGDPDYFQVAATQGGAAIDITGQHGAKCVVSKIVLEPFVSAGTLQVTGHQLSL